MTLIEELLELFEEVYSDGEDAALRSETLSGAEAQGGLTSAEAAQKALEKLKRDMRSYVSMGDERQVEDPRSKYVDVQAELEFYDWLWGDYRDRS